MCIQCLGRLQNKHFIWLMQKCFMDISKRWGYTLHLIQNQYTTMSKYAQNMLGK